MKNAIWISFDLGVRGDYEGLYTWLDEHEAKECGNGIAFLMYDYAKSPVQSLARELRKAISVTNNSRIYAIYFDTDTNKVRGSFVIGRRKAAPWSGYAATGEPADVDEAV